PRRPAVPGRGHGLAGGAVAPALACRPKSGAGGCGGRPRFLRRDGHGTAGPPFRGWRSRGGAAPRAGPAPEGGGFPRPPRGGEGAFIAAVAAGERRPGHVVLRGSKALGESDWQGGGYTSFCRTPSEVIQRLEELGVGVVVLDTSAPPAADLEHHRLLGETV